jgi:hypothetical protein
MHVLLFFPVVFNFALNWFSGENLSPFEIKSVKDFLKMLLIGHTYYKQR